MLVGNELGFNAVIGDIEAGAPRLLSLRGGRREQTEERKRREGEGAEGAKAIFRHKLKSVGNKSSVIYVNYTRSPLAGESISSTRRANINPKLSPPEISVLTVRDPRARSLSIFLCGRVLDVLSGLSVGCSGRRKA
jgi:hypothetical protein